MAPIEQARRVLAQYDEVERRWGEVCDLYERRDAIVPVQFRNFYGATLEGLTHRLADALRALLPEGEL